VETGDTDGAASMNQFARQRLALSKAALLPVNRR
jgi:hypothetical protein